MTGAADAGLAAFLERLESADFVIRVVNLTVGRADEFAKFIPEPFGPEVILLFGHPFLQAEMRFNDEHYLLPWARSDGSCAGYRSAAHTQTGFFLIIKVIAILPAMPLRLGCAPKSRRLSREYYSVC